MAIKWTKTGDWHIARFRDKNLEDCDDDTKSIAARVADLPPAPKVAISFRGVEWVSSRVLTLIVASKAAVGARGGKFAITSAGGKVLEALRIAKLDKGLTIKASTNDLE